MVGDPCLVALCEPRLDLGTGDGKQRPYNGQWTMDNGQLGNGAHAGEAVDAGAADEVEEEGLDIVIAVMGYADGLRALRGGHLGEPLVAQFARGHLDADAVALGIAACAEVLDAEGYVMGVAEATAEGLIGVAGRGTELEVAVQGMHGVSHLVQQQQEGDAVSASAEGHEERVAIFLDGGGGEGLLDGYFHCF